LNQQKKNELPQKIKIGWREYKIIQDEIVQADGEAGNVVYRYNRITINPKLPIQEQQVTLIHEIFHTIFFLIGRDIGSDEHFMNGFSEHIYQVVKDNPELMRFLSDAKEE